MTVLLFPGRHLLNTAFQEQYLRGLLRMPLAALPFVDGRVPPTNTPIDQIVFAVTSANQQHARYNPIPFHVRAIGVDRFARPLEMTFSIQYRIIGIPHYPPTPRFAEFVLKEIEEQTEGDLALTPENCAVLTCTPGVMAMFQQLGFAILPAESAFDPQPDTPNDLLQKLVAAGDQWFSDRELREKVAAATFDLWQDFPDVPRRVHRLWRDPLLTESGDLTASRDYAAYAYGMGNQEIIRLKYGDIKEAILPGKIVDEGCADGALLALIAADFPDSDLIGIEITGEFMARALDRLRAGDFGGAYVHFHQRNIAQPLFEPGSIDTTICNSTTHELWSYGAGEATLRAYLAEKFRQTRAGGRLVIRDVVGPEAKEQEVYMWLNAADGRAPDPQPPTDPEARRQYGEGLSTDGRFHHFAQDFLAAPIRYRREEVDGVPYVVLTLQEAVEFMSKKDYTDNWDSEMHEAFAFWSFSQWKAALAVAGFTVLENPNEPARGSRVYTNPWIVQNRWEGKVKLYRRMGDGRLLPLPWPPTNTVMVGEKQIGLTS
ncbi:MAG: methyltransferase domain-containing protein [Anaerolineae bacterium]|nr:methyltransferase domain-containing protein [Anaerolineae bacterium]